MKVFFLVLYYLIASKLPNYSFPGGKFYNWMRVYCMKRFMQIGEHNRIMRNVYVGNGKDVVIGNNCRINESVRLDNVRIGDHVMIARESVFLGKTHEASDREIPMERQGNRVMNQTIVDDDVWIGIRTIVLPGLRIAKGGIIGAGSVLTKSTEEYSVYAGVPAKKIKSRI